MVQIQSDCRENETRRFRLLDVSSRVGVGIGVGVTVLLLFSKWENRFVVIKVVITIRHVECVHNS